MIYDISPPITKNLKVWPGDTPPSREVLSDMKDGADLTLSTLHATVHLGAHADAPNHDGPGAESIDQRSLDYYLGRCQVISVNVGRAEKAEEALGYLRRIADALAAMNESAARRSREWLNPDDVGAEIKVSRDHPMLPQISVIVTGPLQQGQPFKSTST